MSEHEIELTGWKAIVVVIVLLGVVGLRLVTFSDKKDDTALMRQIELQLTTDYFPNDIEELKTAYETGNADEIARVANSVTSTKLNIEAVKASC